jgi:hypothetical protein
MNKDDADAEEAMAATGYQSIPSKMNVQAGAGFEIPPAPASPFGAARFDETPF